MGLRFIFMLTRNDRTVEDASAQLQTALGLGVRHIGFKDIGLPIAQLKALNAAIKAGGATSYLEVVSLDRDSEIASAKAALDIGVDVLLGGTRAEDVLPVIAGSPIEYYPFPGRIVGHPSVLEGSIEEIVASAKALTARDGVHGLDLLAYRSKGDIPALMRAVCAAVPKPVFIAGSIDTPERIAIVKESGAAGFTIGTAALDGKYPAGGKSVPDQLSAIIRDVARLNNHLSPFSKNNLAASFADLPSSGEAIVPGRINGMDIKLIRFDYPSAWRFALKDDKLVFVHKGRLVVEFRDREETIQEGEFIVIPHGVEHRPAAPEGVCEVVVIAPAGAA